MISNLRPLGALLAALTFWALGLLLLSLAGLGGQVGPHPANAALMPPMPVVTLDTAGDRLGPPGEYLESANRPLLSQDRRPPAIVAESGDAEAPLEVNLTSVLITSEVKLAILQGREDGVSRRVKMGDVLAGTAWRLVALEPRRAVFEGPQGRRELELRVFDGTGGVPPTPQVAAAPPSPPGTPPNEVKPETVAAAPVPAPVNAPAPTTDPSAAPMTPDQQVEAIRRRIEARRAMRAAEANQERPPSGTQQQVQ